MTWEIREGDCREQLRELEPESVQTVVTSPPYWGLRDYGTATWEGGDGECDHTPPPTRASATSTLKNDGRPNPGAKEYEAATPTPYRDTCGKCGAKRIDSQLGLEPTPEQYVENLVAVFREVRRVLRDDGTVWLNLGDSYASQPGKGDNVPQTKQGGTPAYPNGAAHRSVAIPGLKPKDLVGIPWRVAFALQADGWWLRSDVIWAKPNPMPESVTDRPTRTKSARYFYDADAVREGFADERMGNPGPSKAGENPDRNDGGIANNGAGWNRGAELGGRNRRSVWTVATQPYSEAHFATFPPKLIEPCVLAGSTKGALVLDPFSGAGTTGLVATQHGRDFIGLELNPEYAAMARKRIAAWEANPAGTLEGAAEPIKGQIGLLEEAA